MLRIKLPSGQRHARRSCARSARCLERFGRGDGELATRQNVQLHWLELASLPDVFARSTRPGSRRRAAAATPSGTSRAARCRASPHDELFDCLGSRRGGRGVLLREPRLHRPPAQAQVSRSRRARDRCNAPEINCIALVGAIHRRARRLRGAASAAGSPRCRGIARDLGVFVPKRARRSRCWRAMLDAWKDGSPLPRLARQGAAEVHGRRHRARGDARARSRRGSASALEDFELPPIAASRSTTSASTRRSRPGLAYVGVPVHLGLISGDQMVAVADLAERARRATSGSRASRTSSSRTCPSAGVDDVARATSAAIGFPLDAERPPRRARSAARASRTATSP